MPVCQLLSAPRCALWYEQRTLPQSARLSIRVKVTFTAAGLLEQKQTHGFNVSGHQQLKNKVTSTSSLSFNTDS